MPKPLRFVLKLLLALLLLPAGIWSVMAIDNYAAYRMTLARWDPDQAITAANRDIRSGTLKIYLHGSFSASLVGVAEEHRHLVEELPKDYAGVGCIVPYDDVFDAQREYAVRYNQAIVRHLHEKARLAAQ